jgi:hypothetical protein
MTRFSLTLASVLLAAGTSLAQAEMLTFKAELAPASEVPPAADSKGSGMATVMVDTETKKLTWEVTSKDLTGAATAAHIHGPAAVGENAGPMIDISASIEKGSADVTEAQLTELQAGRTYINVHTEKYPGGEIRGQLRKESTSQGIQALRSCDRGAFTFKCQDTNAAKDDEGDSDKS